MGDCINILSISIILFVYSVNSETIDEVKLRKAKQSTFGYGFQHGMNLSCSKKFFNSLHEDDCRIYYSKKDVGNCSDFAIIPENREETEDLNVIPNSFIRTFDVQFQSHTTVGLNLTIPLYNNDTRGYLINFDIPLNEPDPLHRCQGILINSPKPRKKINLWNDQFFFYSNAITLVFNLKVTELPSGKQQTFQSKVISEDMLINEDENNWKSIIFIQTVKNKLIVFFTTALFNVSDYSIELLTEKKLVKRENIAQNGDSVLKVNFYNLKPQTAYCIRIKANCDRCVTSELCFNNTTTETLPISMIIAFCGSLFFVLIFIFVIWTRFELKPRFIRKPFVIQSYDCQVHSEFIFALVKAINQCQCDVLVDKYRDATINYDVKEWIPEAITQCDCILIIWSKGSLNKNNLEFELREPGNTISMNWNFTINQVETKLNQFKLRIANVFWDKTINPNEIKCVFKGYENIFITNDLEKDWKKLISFIYAKDFPLWKRRICRLFRQDLRKFDEGKELLKVYKKLLETYELELITRGANQNADENDDLNDENQFEQLENENNFENEENEDSGFGSRLSSILNSVLSEENRLQSLPGSSLSTQTHENSISPPQLSLQDALNLADRRGQNQESQNSNLSNQSSISNYPSMYSQPSSVPFWNQPTPNQPMPMPNQPTPMPNQPMPIPMQPIYAPVFTYPVMFVPQNPLVFNQNGSSNTDNSHLASNVTQSTDISQPSGEHYL